IFTSDMSVISLLVPVLITLAVINPAQNTLLVYSGSLKGAGDTKRVLIITVSGLLLVRLPLVFFLIKGVGMGLNGAWIAAALEKYLMLLLFFIYFSRGKWRNTRV
ncbi:MAG: MATE family efflux transporter, partial [Spirochaetales bacterium]|nr:MATE family efflux transporter [Spirochaetales bacterium]